MGGAIGGRSRGLMIEVEVFGESGAPPDDQEARADRALRKRIPRLIGLLAHQRSGGVARGAPSPEEVRRLCIMAAASAGIQEGHVAIEFVDTERITKLNAEHRSQPRPTDVLSFPIDGVEPLVRADAIGHPAPSGALGPIGKRIEGGELTGGARELGDVVICPEHTVDVREAVVHGMLHLLGMDHETDHGEMLALQQELLARETG
jgi:probable rRNA maturation factor